VDKMIEECSELKSKPRDYSHYRKVNLKDFNRAAKAMAEMGQRKK
jgi:hypothetical protein